MASTKFDVTLLGFNAIDLREINEGDTVVFRSTSITHNRDLALRHGCTAYVTGFGRSRQGASQVSIEFKDGQQFSVAPINLTPKTQASFETAKQVRGVVEGIVAKTAEQKRPWLAVPMLQLTLGEAGMYDRLGEPARAQQALDDLPF